MTKTIYSALLFVAGLIGLFLIGKFVYNNSSNRLLGVQGASQTVIYSGITNTSTTVNTTSTQVVPGFSEYAKITNNASTSIFCYIDNKTAASSSVAVNAGIKIGVSNTIGSSTYQGEPSQCFGYAAGCVPYIGTINCIGSQKAPVGIVYK